MRISMTDFIQKKHSFELVIPDSPECEEKGPSFLVFWFQNGRYGSEWGTQVQILATAL